MQAKVVVAPALAALLLVVGGTASGRTHATTACPITQAFSVGGGSAATIEFVNASGGAAVVYWLDFYGSRQRWFQLAAGQSQRQGTYIGHAWLVTDLAGTCIGYVLSTEASQVYVIGGSAPTPAPAPTPTPVAAGSKTFSDPPGDGGSGADITTVSVSNDAGGQISMRINFARLSFDDTFILCVDVDRNKATGLQDARFCPLGADYDVYAHFYGPWEISAITQYPGPTLASKRLVSRSLVSISGDANSATLSVSRSDLGGTSGFDFQIWTEPVPGDRAPDSDTWTYTLRSAAPPAAPKPAAPTSVAITTLNVQTRPAAPIAGSAFTLLVPSVALSTGRSVAPTTYRCRATLGTAPLRGSGKGGCTFRIPKSAGGKRLVIVVTAGYGRKTRAKTVGYTVRRPIPTAQTPKPKPAPVPTTPGPPKSKCLAAGVRFSGSTSEKKPICFTIARNGKLLVETKFGYGNVQCTGDDLSLPPKNLSNVVVASTGSLSGTFSVSFSQSVVGQILDIEGGRVTFGTLTVSGTLKGVIRPTGTATGTLDWTLESFSGLTCTKKVPAT